MSRSANMLGRSKEPIFGSGFEKFVYYLPPVGRDGKLLLILDTERVVALDDAHHEMEKLVAA